MTSTIQQSRTISDAVRANCYARMASRFRFRADDRLSALMSSILLLTERQGRIPRFIRAADEHATALLKEMRVELWRHGYTSAGQVRRELAERLSKRAAHDLGRLLPPDGGDGLL